MEKSLYYNNCLILQQFKKEKTQTYSLSLRHRVARLMPNRSAALD